MYGATKYGKLQIGLLVTLILSPSALQAANSHSENMALLAIYVDRERVAAGMMCVGGEFNGMDRVVNFARCSKLEAAGRDMCRQAGASILNPNVLAFDVTSWPRRAIAELGNSLQLMADPLNSDFSGARVAGLNVRRIEEAGGAEELFPTFTLSSGCYLLMIAPDSVPPSGS